MGTGQAHELALAFDRNGWTNADVKKLSEGNMLTDVIRLVRGEVKIEIVKHIIDLDAQPSIPKGWSIEQHNGGGQFEWDPTKVSLYLSEEQKNGVIMGHELCKALVDKACFNANLLEFLLANPTLIPDEWKGQRVFFWGTVYRTSSKSLSVNYLYWDGCKWCNDGIWLDNYWSSNNPAAVLAS